MTINVKPIVLANMEQAGYSTDEIDIMQRMPSRLYEVDIVIPYPQGVVKLNKLVVYLLQYAPMQLDCLVTLCKPGSYKQEESFKTQLRKMARDGVIKRVMIEGKNWYTL